MAKKEISYKQIGQNVTVIIDGKPLTRKIVDKDERDKIKESVIAYNAKNTVTAEKAIIAAFSLKTEAVKEKVKTMNKVAAKINKATKAVKTKDVAIKSTTSKTKKVVDKELTLSDLEEKKELSPEEVERLSKLLAGHKPTIAPVENKPTKRRGEY